LNETNLLLVFCTFVETTKYDDDEVACNKKEINYYIIKYLVAFLK